MLLKNALYSQPATTISIKLQGNTKPGLISLKSRNFKKRLFVRTKVLIFKKFYCKIWFFFLITVYRVTPCLSGRPYFTSTIKDNQMRSPSLLSGPKIRYAYFEASFSKMILMWTYAITFFHLKPQSRLYEFLVQR